MKPAKRLILLIALTLVSFLQITNAQVLPEEFINPPHEFSVLPFWFWNDTLKEDEIIRQIDDFEAHGVYGFVIHPRIGLPENMKWLSPEMIHFMDLAIKEAARRKMTVILYDEGMYPSGSAGGQVVEHNPEYAARGLAKIDLKKDEMPCLNDGEKLVTVIYRPGKNRVAIIERPSGGKIRGLHYIGEGSPEMKEESPPAADILNPGAVDSFIDLVYEKYYKEFGKYFGTTIAGIFTDEPSVLGRESVAGMMPGNKTLLTQVNRITGYDLTPFLTDLWYNDNSDSKKHRIDYSSAINTCLNENYYARIGKWCNDHGILLMGHPAGSMDIGAGRFFNVPGQDLVWRYVEPGPTALEGQHSTAAKCAANAMLHLGRRRNSIELYGAYGHELTYDEMVWLADWCFVRGQNLIIPHAFYYSERGPRFDERPPDVGPNSAWWNKYKSFADACRRLSWLNTDSKQVCNVAILCNATFLPDRTAKVCYENQLDFNYLELRHLWENSIVDSAGVHIEGMNYEIIIIDSMPELPARAIPFLKILAASGRLVINKNPGYASLIQGSAVIESPDDLPGIINKKITPDSVIDASSKDIRYRHLIKGKDDYYILFNEGNNSVSSRIKSAVTGIIQLLNPASPEFKTLKSGESIYFEPHELKIIRVSE